MKKILIAIIVLVVSGTAMATNTITQSIKSDGNIYMTKSKDRVISSNLLPNEGAIDEKSSQLKNHGSYILGKANVLTQTKLELENEYFKGTTILTEANARFDNMTLNSKGNYKKGYRGLDKFIISNDYLFSTNFNDDYKILFEAKQGVNDESIEPKKIKYGAGIGVQTIMDKMQIKVFAIARKMDGIKYNEKVGETTVEKDTGMFIGAKVLANSDLVGGKLDAKGFVINDLNGNTLSSFGASLTFDYDKFITKESFGMDVTETKDQKREYSVLAKTENTYEVLNPLKLLAIGHANYHGKDSRLILGATLGSEYNDNYFDGKVEFNIKPTADVSIDMINVKYPEDYDDNEGVKLALDVNTNLKSMLKYHINKHFSFGVNGEFGYTYSKNFKQKAEKPIPIQTESTLHTINGNLGASLSYTW